MLIKNLWNLGGIIFVIIGSVGVVLPVLPTTPFLLLAAFCFSRGSEKLHSWLINSTILGKYIDNYMKGKGIPLHGKIISILFVWTGIGYSIFKMKDVVYGQIILFIIAVSVSIHIITVKKKSNI